MRLPVIIAFLLTASLSLAGTGDILGLQVRTSTGTKPLTITAPTAGQVLKFSGTPATPLNVGTLSTSDITGFTAAMDLKANLAGANAFTGVVTFSDTADITTLTSPDATIIDLSVTGSSGYSVASTFAYHATAAAAHRTALGLGTLATQSGTFSGTSSGTNTGDQTSIVGITGTMAQFDTAASDGNFVFQSGAGGTPSSLTLTNATGLPVSGITASTSTALGVGSIELGHATDTTISRTSAGMVNIEGSNVLTAGNSVTGITGKIFTTAYASTQFQAYNGSYYMGISAAGNVPKIFTTIEHDITVQTNSTATNTATKNHVVFSHANSAAVFASAIVTTPQALSGAGAVNVTTSSTAFTSTGAAQALTLADGINGQIKTIAHVVDGGSGVLTPTTKSGYTTITFTNVGDAVTLQFFTGAGWCIVGIHGAVAA